MTDDRNLGVCPDCEGDMDIVELEGDKPFQYVEHRCSSCDTTTSMAVCWYPDDRYVGVASALEEDDCSEVGCDADAVIRYQPVELGMTDYQCTEHAPGYLLTTCDSVGVELPE